MNRCATSSRRLIGAAALACALALPLSATAAPPGCATSGLVVWLQTPPGSGTAGAFYYDLKFTNLSGHACRLQGYPGVSGVDLHGRRLGSPASRNGAHPARAVTLRNGATAVAVLRITDVGNYPGSICRRVAAAGLRVYPPNQTSAKLVPFPFGACSRRGPGYLSVEPVA